MQNPIEHSGPSAPAAWQRGLRGILPWVALAIGAVAACTFAADAPAQANAPVPATAIADTRARAERGDAEAQFELARRHANGDGLPQDPAQAAAWFERAAVQGHARAQNNLGAAYALGVGVAKDEARAAQWYLRAAEQGQMYAQFNLGVLYASGRGVAHDPARAAAWFRKAADQGMPEAQFEIGRSFEFGQGVWRDTTEAAVWYRKAADQGWARAQAHLGTLYALGEGVPQDIAQGLAWYRRAAEQYDRLALHNLGRAYQFGVGVAQDPVEAYKWLTLGEEAERELGAESQKALADSREALARSLTPDQRAEAERRGMEWLQAYAQRQAAQPRHADAPTAAQPSLRLANVAVAPKRVRPGAAFTLEVAYTATDPAASGKVPVTLTFSVLSGSTVLVESPAEVVESASGEAWKVTKPLTAARSPGKYAIRVRLSLGATVVTREVEFEIAR